ncbi:unnamed protein product [Urochloa humidicola]
MRRRRYTFGRAYMETDATTTSPLAFFSRGCCPQDRNCLLSCCAVDENERLPTRAPSRLMVIVDWVGILHPC